jgi:hypothetical protein
MGAANNAKKAPRTTTNDDNELFYLKPPLSSNDNNGIRVRKSYEDPSQAKQPSTRGQQRLPLPTTTNFSSTRHKDNHVIIVIINLMRDDNIQ